MRELQDRYDGRRVADGLEKHRLHFEFWEQDRKLGAISIVAIVRYFEDKNNYGGCYAAHLGQMSRAMGTSFGFH
jgi:hypothetical protein